MRTVAIGGFATIIALASGCESRLPTVDTGRAPAAAFGAASISRPFAATLTGAVTYAVPAECPPDCRGFTTITDATGEATHLGRVTVHMSHRPYDVANHQDGSLTMTAANGDKLYGVYDYDLSSNGPIPVTITGGTGRFAQASGTILTTATTVKQFKPMPPCVPATDPFGCLDPDVPWPWSATMTGAIGY